MKKLIISAFAVLAVLATGAVSTQAWDGVVVKSGAGPHVIGTAEYNKVVLCDANSGGPTIKLDADATGSGTIKIVRMEQNGNDNANYCTILPENGDGTQSWCASASAADKISNFCKLVLPIENDYVEVTRDETLEKWFITGGGQVPWKGYGGQHRTPDSRCLPNKVYQAHAGDFGAVIRVVTGTGGSVPPSCTSHYGAVSVYLPSLAEIRSRRTQDYASTARVCVMITNGPNTSYAYVTTPNNETPVGYQTGWTINVPGRITCFENDSGQWFVVQ